MLTKDQSQMCNALEDQDFAMFMDDTTLSLLIISNQLDSNFFGNTQANVNRILRFAENERMELNCKKCTEIIIDFRKNISLIPPVQIDGNNVSRTKLYKILEVWLENNLTWKTNTEYTTRKAAKRVYLLKIVKSYGAPTDDLLAFYFSVIRPILECGVEIWNGGLTQEQKKSIE